VEQKDDGFCSPLFLDFVQKKGGETFGILTRH
jgi:hypothetical protein